MNHLTYIDGIKNIAPPKKKKHRNSQNSRPIYRNGNWNCQIWDADKKILVTEKKKRNWITDQKKKPANLKVGEKYIDVFEAHNLKRKENVSNEYDRGTRKRLNSSAEKEINKSRISSHYKVFWGLPKLDKRGTHQPGPQNKKTDNYAKCDTISRLHSETFEKKT